MKIAEVLFLFAVSLFSISCRVFLFYGRFPSTYSPHTELNGMQKYIEISVETMNTNNYDVVIETILRTRWNKFNAVYIKVANHTKSMRPFFFYCLPLAIRVTPLPLFGFYTNFRCYLFVQYDFTITLFYSLMLDKLSTNDENNSNYGLGLEITKGLGEREE